MNNFKPLTPFRFWCQKVIPLVYDESLSYYELLCKVIDYLNHTMEDVNALGEDYTELYNMIVQLRYDLEHLDVQDEVNKKLDEMAEDGTLANLIAPYLPSLVSPSRTLQLLRHGRLLDEFGKNSRSQVLYGQACAFYDGRYYECGSVPGNATQAISVWGDDGTLITYKNDYTQLYHANGIAVDEDYIYIACQDTAHTIAIINKSDLSIDNLVTFADLENIFSITNYNGHIYFMSSETNDDVTQFLLNLYDPESQSYTTVCRYNRPAAQTPQNFCMYNDKVYFLFVQSNIVYRFNLTSPAPEYIYYIPLGDGLYPTGECEDLFVMNNEIYLYSCCYDGNTNRVSYPYDTFTQIFTTDLINPLDKDMSIDYMYLFEQLEFIATAGSYTFNPGKTVTTLSELSALANYHKNCQLQINDISHGRLYLKDGNYAIEGFSGARSFDVLEATNCRITLSVETIDKIDMHWCDFKAFNIVIGTLLDVIRCNVELNHVYMRASIFNMERSHVAIRRLQELNASIGYNKNTQNFNYLNVKSLYLSGLLKLLQCATGSTGTGTYSCMINTVETNNYGFTDGATRAALIAANAGTATNHILSNSAHTNVKYLNGNLYVTTGGTEAEVSGSAFINCEVYIP